MVNLLSEQQIIARARAYRARLVALVLMAISTMLIAAVLLTGPFVLDYRQSETAYRKEIARINDLLATTDLGRDEELIAAQASVLAGAQQVSGAQPKSAIVEYIVAAAPKAIRVLSILLSAGPTVAVHGEAANRQALVAFADALRATPGIAHVDVPIANFVEGKDAPFSITFVLDAYE